MIGTYGRARGMSWVKATRNLRRRGEHDEGFTKKVNWAKSISGDEKRAVQRSENYDAPASEHLINLRSPHPQLPYTDVTPTRYRVSKNF